MSIEGSLADFRLQEILQAVAQQRRTGILTVQSETTIVAVSFLAGGVVSADSLAHTLEERLGDALVAEGRVDVADVRELTRRQDAGEGRLVDLLVSDGLLSREEVLAALRQQNHSLLLELLDWAEGEFKFYGGDEVAYEEGIEPIAVDDFLLAQLDDDGAPPDDDELVAEGWADLPAEDEPAGWSEDELPRDAELAYPGQGESVATGPVRPFGGPVDGVRAPTVEPGERQVAADAGPESSAPAPAVVVRRPVVEPVEPDEPTATPAAGGRSIAALLGLSLAIALVAAAVIAPGAVFLPFPWQEGDRRASAEVQRLADRLAVDRAAKTFFLIEGRFPDRLDRLVELGLLDGEDHSGPEGEPLELIAGEESYDVVAAGVDQPLWSEAITGNFLLDPELRGDAGIAGSNLEAPLVLLD